MRLHRVLLTPWVASPRSTSWLVVAVLALVALADALAHVYGLTERMRTLDAIALGIVNGVCWLLLLPNGLLLALAARRLRLPGIGRDVAWGLLLYAGLGIGVPMLCHFPDGHVLGFAIVQVLVAAGALLFMMLPAYLGLGLYFLWLFSQRALPRFVSLSGSSDPRLIPWGGALVVVLVLALAWRWRQLLRGEQGERGWRAPNLVNFRRSLGSAQSDPLTDAASMRRRPDWLLARADLRHVGPRAPAKALRIALGGVYLPQTITGRLYQWIPGALILLVTGLILVVVTSGDHDVSGMLHYVLSRDGFVALSWMFPVLSLMFVMMPVELIALRWGRPNAELSVLALLPGLDAAPASKRVLLGATLVRPAIQVMVLLLVGWSGAASLDAGWSVAVAMLVVALGCIGYLGAMALSIFGGRPLSGFSKSLLMIGMFVLLSFTVLLPQLWQNWNVVYATATTDALVVAWLALAMLLGWLARRGAIALRQRPHPFLVD